MNGARIWAIAFLLAALAHPAGAQCVSGSIVLSPTAAGQAEVYCGPSEGVAYSQQNLSACTNPDIYPTQTGQQRVYCGANFGWVWGMSSAGAAACASGYSLYPMRVGDVPIFCGPTLGIVWVTPPAVAACGAGQLDFTQACNAVFAL